MERKLLTEKQLAEKWNMRVETLRNWRFLGRGPTYLKLGASVRYDSKKIDEFERRGTVDPTQL